MEMIGSYEIKKSPLECADVDHLMIQPHLHAEWECVICLSGSSTVHINDAALQLNPSEMVIVAPYSFHYYEANVGDYIVLCFNSEMLPTMKKKFLSNRPRKNIIAFSDDPILYDTVIALKNMFSVKTLIDEHNIIDETVCVGYLNLIMFFSFEYFNFAPIDIDKTNLCRKIVDYCTEYYTEMISLETISNELGISRTYISRLFNSQMQMSLTTFVNWLRISDACNALRYTTESITDIAHNVGFGSIRAFNRTFQTFISKSPSVYRENCKNHIE